MLQDKINKLYNNFEFEGKRFHVKDCKIKEGKAFIYTDTRTFAFFESELDVFLGKIELLDLANLPVKFEASVRRHNEPINMAELMNVNNRADRLSDGLEKMFNDLASNPSDEGFKKAKSMVDVSNAIVNVEMVRYKCLTLNR